MNKYADKYKNLSPEQKQFVDKKKISTTMRIGKWQGLLSNISKFDKRNDNTIKRLKSWIITFYVLAFLSVFTFAFLESDAVYLIMGFAGIATLLLSHRNKLKTRDVSDYLRNFFMPMLNVLEAKCGTDAKLSANLDFRIPRQALSPHKSKVGQRNLNQYQPRYIVASVKMLDGTLLEFVVSDEIKDFSWKKRSASGKTKYKSKSKFVHHCLIKLTLPKSEYKWVKRNVNHPSISIAEVEPNYLAKAKIKSKTVGSNNMLKPELFLEMMQQIYNHFDPKHGIPPQMQDKQPEQNAPQPGQDRGRYNQYDDRNDMMYAPYLWYGHGFGMYDYDSFEHNDSGDQIMDDDSVTAFDS